eukprot:449302_1
MQRISRIGSSNIRRCLHIETSTSSQIGFRSFSKKINKNDEDNKINQYFPMSIQPILLNFYLAFFLRASIDTGIFDAIPKDENESISIEDICKQCNLDKDITYRCLRYMSSMGYTKEVKVGDKSGFFHHTKESADLRKDGQAYYTLRAFIDPFWKNSWFQFSDYLKHTYGNGPDTFEKLNGQSYWDRIANNEMARKDLYGTLNELNELQTETEINNVITDYISDIDINNRNIIDIGGGIGELIYDICVKDKHINGTLFDLDTTIEEASKVFADKDEIENLKLVSGDFFNEDDVIKYGTDCNVFMLKRVIHDWDDEKNILILNNIRKAIGNDTKNKILLIFDAVLTDELNNSCDLGLKALNIMLYMGHCAKERQLSEYDALFKKTKFKRDPSYPKPFSNLNVIKCYPI